MELEIVTANISIKDEYQQGDIRRYSDLVFRAEWKEEFFNNGGYRLINQEGDIWTKAIQKAIDENEIVYIPPLQTPVYIDDTLIIPSHRVIHASDHTIIRMLPQRGFCMMQNEKLKYDHDEFDYKTNPNIGIIIDGGVWSTCSNGIRDGNGNHSQHFNPQNDLLQKGVSGVFTFSNVRDITIKNLKIFDVSAFAIQISGCEDFLIENIIFDNAFYDGVHLNGPAENGIIRNISGLTGDDIIALNAWDWSAGSMSCGTIRHVLVENIQMKPGYLWSEIRLLSGVSNTCDGRILDCAIEDCQIKNIKGIHTVKGYNQPCKQSPFLIDHALPGRIERITFSDMEFNYINPENYYTKKFAAFEFCADCRNLIFENILFCYPLRNKGFQNWYAVSVGPMTAEFLNSESFCNVLELKFINIFHMPDNNNIEQVKDPQLLVCEKTIKDDNDKIIGSGKADFISLQ